MVRNRPRRNNFVGDQLTYDEMVEKLRNCYGSKGLESRFRSELKCRRRRKDETLRELCQDISRLMTLAFPGNYSNTAEHLAQDSFLRALDELAFQVLAHEPTGLDDAYRKAQQIEVSRQGLGSYGRVSVSRETRDVSVGEDALLRTRNRPDDGLLGGAPDKGAPPSVPVLGEQLKSEVRNKNSQRTFEQKRSRRRNRAANETQTDASNKDKEKIKRLEAEVEELKRSLERRTSFAQQTQNGAGAPSGNYPTPTQGFSTPTDVGGYNPQTFYNSNQGGGDRPRLSTSCWSCGLEGHRARFARIFHL